MNRKANHSKTAAAETQQDNTTLEAPLRHTLLRRGIKLTALAAAGALAIPTIVGAVTGGNPTPQRVTGCLKTDGTVFQLALGDTPRAACTGTQKQITVANGDVTGITPGLGLAGGGTEGTLSLGLTPKFALPQGCATGTAAKASSTGWYCGSDFGRLNQTVAAPGIDTQTAPHNGSSCVGDVTSGYVLPLVTQTATSASFTLPTGTFQPTTSATTRWFVNRTYDMFDGEQFTQGYVRMQIIRTRAGVDTTVATWARVESGNQDGTGMPYIQDLGSFTAFASDTYRIVSDGLGARCSRVRLLNHGLDFTLVG